MRNRPLCRMVWVGWAASAALAQAQVQIYLPRQIAVNDGALRLGTVAVVRGEPGAAETASQVALGQLVLPGQKMTIDRTTVLSRLASSGIPASQVTFTGADQVMVARAGHTLSGTDLTQAAKTFAQQTCPGVAQVEIVSTAKDLAIDGNQPDLRLVPRWTQAKRSSGSVRVHVAVLSGTSEVAGQDVLVRLRYKGHKITALGDLAKGTAVSAENVRIEETLIDQAPATAWRPPYGRVLRRAAADGTEIRDDSLAEPLPALAIKRNDMVVIRLERPGVLITATGKTLSDGHVGETIKVRNVDSNRIVLCKVRPDGTVEPVI